MNLIALAGYARTGKTTAAKTIGCGWRRAAFADALKRDLSPLLAIISASECAPEDKARLRPLYVAWGETARAFRPSIWIDRLFANLDATKYDRIIIDDVRYINEAQAVIKRGGTVIRIDRPGYGPANDEEALSFTELDAALPDLPRVINDKTPAAIAFAVLHEYNTARKLAVQ